jgi:hypothetical protein
VQVDYAAKRIFLKYFVTIDQLKEEFVRSRHSRKPILLVDYISERIEKCDLERQYCSRFLFPAIYDRILVKLEIHNAEDECVDSISLELADEGYPGVAKKIKAREPRFDGRALREKHSAAADILVM